MGTKDTGDGGGGNRCNALRSKEQRQAGQHSSTVPLEPFASGQLLLVWGMVFCPQSTLSRSALTDLPRSTSLR